MSLVVVVHSREHSDELVTLSGVVSTEFDQSLSSLRSVGVCGECTLLFAVVGATSAQDELQLSVGVGVMFAWTTGDVAVS